MTSINAFAMAAAAAILAVTGFAVAEDPVSESVTRVETTRTTKTYDPIVLEKNFKTTYIYKTYLKNDNVVFTSKEGTVTLTGTVDDERSRIMAAHVAENLPGVTTVYNKIEVRGEPPTEMSDAWIAAKVRGALLFYRNVSATNTNIDVSNGVVTLSGTATSEAQRELTAEYAKDVEGVKEVRNEMTVVSAEPPTKTIITTERTVSEIIDDASITTQVKMALLSRRSTSALKTGVSTRDGVVTLTGRAANQAEKDLVAKLVNDIEGVKTVVNNMTVVGTSSGDVIDD